MDYNDNDYEGHNLHLAGEESSKHSSTLRPFVLPKFDFDDNHLRFDSLVDNEVFLGIPSQDDNQWIEDFSRGSSGIQYCSSATVSCGLPRCNNVWSEATSSESVEMLLKAVGQDEMIPGESMVNESDLVNQVDLTGRIGTNLSQDDKMDDVDGVNPLLPSSEVEKDSSALNQSAGIEGVSSDADERKLSSYERSINDDKENNLIVTETNLNSDMSRICEDKGESHDLVNDSLSEQVEERLPVSETGIDNLDSSYQVHDRMLVDQDNIIDTSFVSSGCISEGIAVGVDEQKDVPNSNDEILGGNTVLTVNSEMECSPQFPPVTESLNEQHTVEIQVNKFDETSSMPETGEISAVEDCGKVIFDVEPAIGTGCESVISTSISGIKQLSEVHSVSHDGLDVKGEGCADVLDTKGSDDTPKNYCNEPEQVSVTQLTDQPEINACDEDIYPGSSCSSLETPFATIESSKPCSPERGPDNLIDSSFAGEHVQEKSVVECIKEPIHNADVQKESLEDGNKQTFGEDSLSKQADDNLSMQADVQGGERHVHNVVSDDNGKVVGFEVSCELAEVNVETATASQSNASAGDYHVLNADVEDEKLKPSCPDGEELAECREQRSPSFGMGYIDQSKELEAAKQLSTSSSVQPLEVVAEVATATKVEKIETLDSVGAGGTKTDDPPVSLVETSNTAIPDEATQELSEKAANPASDSVVQNEDTEKKMEAKIESSGANSSKVSDSCSAAAEIDESKQPGASSTNLTDQAQGELSKKESLERDVLNVGGALPTSTNSGVNALSKQEGSFTFNIRHLGGQSTEDPNKSLQQIPRNQAIPSSAGEESPSTTGSSQKDIVTVKEITQPTSLMPSGGAPSSEGVKSASDRKPRRRSSKTGKESAKGGTPIKEAILPQQTDKLPMFPSPLGAGQLMKFDGPMKPIAGLSVSASSLPDLNTSGPPSAIFRQPFTDLQQVQLRGQIFVYGSLIQGAAPDEACMISAFGASDGGRNAWEPSWRAFIEKRNSKQTNKIETPIQSRSGAKASGQTSTHISPQSEVLSTPISRTTDKAAPSPLVNPVIPLSSPLWNMPTPSSAGQPSSTIPRFDYPVLSPLHPYQTPPIRSFAPHTTTWPSQAPYPVPWLASSKSSPFDICANYPASPITEPVKLTPIIESSVHVKNHVPHVPAIHTGATSVFTGTPTLVDLKKVTGSTSQTTPSGNKTRKRKKSSAVDTSQVDTVSTSVIANNLPKKVPAVNSLDSVSVVSGRYSTPVAAPTFGVPSSQIFSPVLPSVSSDKRALDLESLSKVEEAKLHAEQAAALSNEAVSHCQSVWSKLDQLKNSGVTKDAEAKLASAAVAIAAAASVAKAAAAAAKIASHAAMQAKMIADEAFTAPGSGYNTDFTSSSVNMTHGSTLAISDARQAARKRGEDASAASKHAENLDAILKAAELAAEAVSHTGKIVGMGDPFSLNELVRAGPDGYWKISHVGPGSGSEPKETDKNKVITGEVPNVSKKLHVGPDKDVRDSGHVVPPIVNASMIAEGNLVNSVKNGGSSVKPQKDKRVFNRAEAIGSVSESDIELRSRSFTPYESNASIKEGSAVEVLKDLGNVKKAWLSANVLSLKDDKALVCYTELLSDEAPLLGSEKVKEWVSLQAQVGEAPVIRTARPMTAMQFDGTRKRRRSATKDYDWSVGDRVDAWVKDCWREGIITEKNKKGPTTLTVSFPAEEEILSVKAWHLRPTLIWSDNQWSECWRRGENDISQGDAPLEKRPKLGTADIESKGKGKMAKKTGFPEAGRTNEQLPLSVKESVFNIGTTNADNNVRTMRPGLQKEGPRTLFGVPKPGKKRKFMEVSKHYVSERTNRTTTLNDSAKSAKSSVPLRFGSRVSKNNPKVESKEKKQVPESKPRKPPVPTRTLPRTRPNTSTATSSDRPGNGSSTSNSNDDNDESGERNVNEVGSFSNVEGTSKSTFAFSSRALPTENRKKAAVRSAKPEQPNKGKLQPKYEKLAEKESGENSESEVAEPRRSNRRIQPTSRLLEGLQSSLIIPKFPSSHDKGQRSHRGTPKRE